MTDRSRPTVRLPGYGRILSTHGRDNHQPYGLLIFALRVCFLLPTSSKLKTARSRSQSESRNRTGLHPPDFESERDATPGSSQTLKVPY